MKTDTTAELTRESLLRLRANDSEEMTETTWGDFIDANGLSFEEIAEIRTKLIAGRKAVVGGGGAPVLTVFWPTRGVVGLAAPKPKFIPVALADEVEVSVTDERTGKRRVTTWGQWKADLDGGAALVPEDLQPIEQDLLSRGESAFMDQAEGDGVLWRMRLVSGGAR